ncbi:hypothetical protein B9Z55_004926 [Caenorhabditis nigoni]|uniref:Uncharacterized protein n=1 Tax=Caenorhabditis nigoni TaxID=1611254 RepID=A0A2G5UYN6_9PELO|nr:hypothetical protein B9Z55_004926 [Caenorhabditis nigoni]
MLFPSLFQLAAKSVAQQIHNDSYKFDIVSLLEKALHKNSRSMIVHLGLAGENEAFMSGWEGKISKLLPSLQSLKVTDAVFCPGFQLSNLYNSFPNLCVLNISYAENISTLKGIKNLKHLQKLVMRGIELVDIDGYKELSELKNLRFLDVSDYDSDSFRVIRSLLTSDVRMQNLEFLDCSMTLVEDHELKEFVKCHPKLKTVVAISTRCDNSHIPTINLLNFFSTDSTIKSLEYAITNDRDDLAKNCIFFIGEKLDTSHDQLNDSEIGGFLNVLRYALKESKNDMVKYFAIRCFAESRFFETKRFLKSFWHKLPGVVELLFTSWEYLKCSVTRRKAAFSLIITVFERMVNFLRMGKILQEELLNFIVEKTVELSCQYPENSRKVTLILLDAHRYMSLDLYTTLFTDKKMVKGLFEFAHYLIRLDSFSYQQIMELIFRYLNQASKEMLNYLVSNCQVVDKCYEQVMILSQLPNKVAQKHLSNIVLRLMWVIDTNGFRNRSDKSRALMFCSTLSVLLAKKLIENREEINIKIKDFNDSWGQSNFLDCPNLNFMIIETSLNSAHSTDELIRFGLLLMPSFVNVECFLEAKELWNWMKNKSEYFRNSRRRTKNTRESAEKVLQKMEMVKNEWWSQFL